MSGFLRPAAIAALLRWREAAIGCGAALLGLWWIVTGAGIMRWVGVAFALGGVAILREGFARARRPADGTGAGVVEVDERQITYLSGMGGGTISLDALVRVHVVTDENGTRWVFTPVDGSPLDIPVDAVGASQIFDAVAALPGVTHEQVMAATGKRTDGHHTIWQHPETADRPRLH